MVQPFIAYCRTCDLGFCKEHQDQHGELGTRHEVGPWPEGAEKFCCVCTGIYAPPPLARDEKL